MSNLRHIAALVLLITGHHVLAQKYSTVDIVKVKGIYEKEALYFYQENWVAFRKEALAQGYISRYDMLRTVPDSAHNFQLILTTEYPDSLAFHDKEKNFAPIMKRISPNGPKMLNDIPRKDFLEYLSGHDATVIAAPENSKSELEQISETLMDYIEGTANGEPERLKRAFHPDFNLYTVTEKDSLKIRPGAAYVAGIKAGEKANRIGRIISIDYENNAAMAKAEIVVPNWKIFTDYFLLLKYEGAWKIVQKSYTWRPFSKNEEKAKDK